jgi:hypothetical protein
MAESEITQPENESSNQFEHELPHQKQLVLSKWHQYAYLFRYQENNRLDSSSLPSLLTMENKSIIGLILANNQIAIRMIETVMINEKFNREIKLD